MREICEDEKIFEMLHFILIFVLLISLPAISKAQDLLKEVIPEVEVIGEARYQAYYTDLYDLELLAEEGVYNSDNPFAFRFTYLQRQSKEKIIDRILDEMAGQGVEDEALLESWRNLILPIIPDMQKRDELLVIKKDHNVLSFIHDGQFQGDIEDSTFIEAYFKVWLGEDVSEPEKQKELLNIRQ